MPASREALSYDVAESNADNLASPGTVLSTEAAVEANNIQQVANWFGPDVAVQLVKAGDGRLQPLFKKHWAEHCPSVEMAYCIQCGAASNGLAVLIFVDETKGKTFLDTNPSLKGTLATTWAGLTHVWLRIERWRPPNTAEPGMAFLSDGLVPVLQHTMHESRPVIVPERKINTTAYEALHWPASLSDYFFNLHTVSKWGPLLQRVRRKVVLNLKPWSFIVPRSLGLIWDTDAQVFLCRQPDKTYKPMPLVAVTGMVTEYIRHLVQQEPAFSLGELRAPLIQQLIVEIQAAAAFTRLGAGEALSQFVRRRLCLKPGGSLTVDEIHRAYLEHGRKLAAFCCYPRFRFQIELPRAILKEFTLPRVNDIMRPHVVTRKLTARRGFHGLGFRTDGADGPDGGVVQHQQPGPEGS